MADTYVDAGSLSERLELLEFRQTAEQTWEWVPIRRIWAKVEQTTKTNLFSKVGVGARDAAVVIRRQSLTLHQALSWKGQHLFLTSITKRDRLHLDVQAALVDPVLCRANTDEEEPGAAFPGILTEKYAKWEQPEPYSINRLTYVLVASILPLSCLTPGRIWGARRTCRRWPSNGPDQPCGSGYVSGGHIGRHFWGDPGVQPVDQLPD